ncbi:MAG: formimidoylglutamate deiminase [Nocardioides sp.]|nr:formimidoylglutamate deiminase [Nocardioides sp.]
MTAYLLEHAWLGGPGTARNVRVEVADGRFTRVEPGGVVTGAEPVPGLTLPGLANTHSHVFHRALRGRTEAADQDGGGSFWTWRQQMYAVAARLDPDSLFALARATYLEMVLAGITAVGEFHYLHHRPDGSPYPAHAMEQAVAAAAGEAGIALTLLDTCYLTADLTGEGAPTRPVEGVQRRFSDGDVGGWCRRVDALAGILPADVVLGAAIHSVRAVSRADLPVVAGWAREHGAPLHVHLSEQPAEDDACREAWGCTPTALLAAADVLGPDLTVVHATHVTDGDVRLLGDAGVHLALCPTTERDLADGIAPAGRLVDAGATLTLGSDSNAVVDLLEEARAAEAHERLATGTRGRWSSDALLRAATSDGCRALGRPGDGRIAVGARADLVTLDLGTPRTAGALPATAALAATAADVVRVVTAGEERVARGTAAHHATEVGAELAVAVRQAWGEES